jgi:UDP-4-amino-4,6-dideoxy-N-acetyl-beta-L-altrosamine transaminase
MQGGTRFIPYSRQTIEADDIEAVITVLKSDCLTQGPAVDEFERKLSEYTNARYAVAMSSGTAALHAAYFAAGIEADSEVITSPITFAATSNAALMLEIKPVFVDVEPDTGNMDTGLIEGAVSSRTKAIVPVHYAGHPVDMSAVHALARRHGLVVIEDACHAIGAEYGNQNAERGEWLKVGSCMHSDITVFSFHPVKPMTTGEGGAALTNDPEIYQRLKQFRTHGITKENFMNEPHGEWYYEMQFLGNNYRITDIQAALGASQLKKLDGFTERRRMIVARYNEAFKDNPYFDLPVERPYARPAHHLYPIRLKDAYKKNKRVVFSRLKEKGLGVQVHYIPVYLQPFYESLGYKKGLCPVAEDFYQSEISVPLYPSMEEEDINSVINQVTETFQKL